jgi:hypothetical protein
LVKKAASAWLEDYAPSMGAALSYRFAQSRALYRSLPHSLPASGPSSTTLQRGRATGYRAPCAPCLLSRMRTRPRLAQSLIRVKRRRHCFFSGHRGSCAGVTGSKHLVARGAQGNACCLTLGFYAHFAVSQLPLRVTTAAGHAFYGLGRRACVCRFGRRGSTRQEGWRTGNRVLAEAQPQSRCVRSLSFAVVQLDVSVASDRQVLQT